MMTFLRRIAIVATASAAVVAIAIPAQAKTLGWRVDARVKVSKEAVLSGIAALGRSDAWALGSGSTGQPPILGIVEHWNGKSWRRITLPPGVAADWDAANPLFVAAGATSDSNLWAFSLLSATYLRKSGTTWSTGTLPAPSTGSPVPVVTVVRSSTDVWALGGASTRSSVLPYAAHFDGTSWSVFPVPGSGPIVGVSALSAKDIWAVIGDPEIALGPVKSSIVHWNGSTWKTVKLSSPLPGIPSSIIALSDHKVWIGGGRRNSKHGLSEYAALWTGTKLHVANLHVKASSGKYHMVRLRSDGAGGVWGLAINGRLTVSRLWHLVGSTWHGPSVPSLGHDSLLYNLTRVPGETSMWGVGVVGDRGLIAVDGRLP
jgi:hypothetical protein